MTAPYVSEAFLVEGPFFNQAAASSVLIQPTGGVAGQPVALGAMAAAAGSAARNANGLPTAGVILNLTDGKTVAGIPMTASATSANMGISMTPGTAQYLVSNAASGGTVTNTVLWETNLPQSYVAGQTVTINVEALQSLTTGATLTTSQIVAQAYTVNNLGTHSAGLISSGNTIALTGSTAVAGTAVIPATGLAPGGHIVLTAVSKQVETAGTNAVAEILSVSLS